MSYDPVLTGNYRNYYDNGNRRAGKDNKYYEIME